MVTNESGAWNGLLSDITAHSSYEHVSDDVLLDGDLSLEEHLLAARYPLEYDLKVNGIRHIPVRYDDFPYVLKDGKLALKEVF